MSGRVRFIVKLAALFVIVELMLVALAVWLEKYGGDWQ